MFLNKRYLAGFGIFVVVAGLYGFISFTSYPSFEAAQVVHDRLHVGDSNADLKVGQASGQVPEQVPVAASGAESAPTSATNLNPAPQFNASPNAETKSASGESQVPFVGPPTELEFRKAAEKNGQPQKENVGSASSSPSVHEQPVSEIKDPTLNQKTENVYGPVDPSLKVESAAISAQTPKARVRKAKQVADEVASDFDVIASADQAVSDEQQPDTRESWLKSLGISMKQYRLIQQREERLAKEVKTAEKEKAIGSKELLVAEYQEWLLEYLGPDRYAKFSELAAK